MEWLYIMLGFLAGIITTMLFVIEFIKKFIKMGITKSNDKEL